MKSSRSQGSALATVAVILVVVIIGGLGFVLWQKSTTHETQKTEDVSAKSQPKSGVEPTAQVKVYDLGDAVSGINTALMDVCSGETSVKQEDFIQVKDTDLFEYRGGKSLIDQQFSYAYVQYGCGSQGSVALMKRTNTDWRIISRDARIYPMCDAIHGESFPTAIVDKCYQTDRSAEPTDIE